MTTTEQVRTMEQIALEYQDITGKASEAFRNGDFSLGMELQATAQKLTKEMTGFNAKAEQVAVREAQDALVAEIREAFESPLLEAVKLELEQKEFVDGPLAKAVEGGITSYTVVIKLPGEEQELSIAGKFGGGSQPRRRGESTGTRAASGPRAKAIVVDGVEYKTKIALVEALGDAEQQAKVANPKTRNQAGHIADDILKAIAAEGSHTIEYVT